MHGKRSGRILSAWLAALVAVAGFGYPAAAAVPNDPGYVQQWFLEAAGLPAAWDFAKGSPTVKVAVLDTGVDLRHPDLKDRIWTNPGEQPGDGVDNDGNGYVDDVNGWDFVDDDNAPEPDATKGSLEGVNHGTLVAGIIGAAAGNAEGGSGVNWNVKIMPLRVLNSAGSGSTASVDAAVRYAVAKGAKVINISFIGSGYSQTLANTLRLAHRAGVVIVAAAGNEGDTERGGNLNAHPEYPVCYKGQNNEPIIIGVSSLDRAGRRSSFSNYGSDCVSISAPGENIYTTQVYRPEFKDYAEPYGSGWSGSSLAAPVVSGIAALISSMNPGIAPDEVRRVLMAQATNIDDINGTFAGQLGSGKVDAAASVLAVQQALLSGGIVGQQPPAGPAELSLPKGESGLFAVVPASGAKPTVLVLKPTMNAFSGFDAFARGVSADASVAFADLHGNGQNAIVVGAPRGELPYVRTFTHEGALIGQFLAYDKAFRGGVRTARLDIDGDGRDEIMTGAGSGGSSEVRIFDATGNRLGSFLAFGGKDRSGVRLAAADLDHDGVDEIIAASSGPKKTVKVFGTAGNERFSFDVFDRAWRGGLNVAAGDVDDDGEPEIIVGAGLGGPPRVAVFDRFGRLQKDFYAFDRNLRTGVALSVGGFGGSREHIIAGTGPGAGQLRILSHEGTIERQGYPFGPRFVGGVTPAAPRLFRAEK